MQYDRYETPTSRSPWLFLLALVLVWVGWCYNASASSGDPDYITRYGTRVYDPGHRATKEDVELWTDYTYFFVAPMDRLLLDQHLDGAVLVIHPERFLPEDASPCKLPPGPGYVLLGCTDYQAQEIIVHWSPCNAGFETAGVFAHETMHLIGYFGHLYYLLQSHLLENAVDNMVCQS